MGLRHHLVCHFRQLDRPTSRARWSDLDSVRPAQPGQRAFSGFGVLRLVLSIVTLGTEVVIWRMALKMPRRVSEAASEEVRDDEAAGIEA